MSRHQLVCIHQNNQSTPSSNPLEKQDVNAQKLLRIQSVLELIPVSRSTWWAWVASGKAPAPIKLGRTTCWRYADILNFIEQARG